MSWVKYPQGDIPKSEPEKQDTKKIPLSDLAIGVLAPGFHSQSPWIPHLCSRKIPCHFSGYGSITSIHP